MTAGHDDAMTKPGPTGTPGPAATKPGDRDDKPDPKNNKPIHVTVRTLAGHSRKESVKPGDAIADITNDAVSFFLRKGQLTEGAYALTLPRTGQEAELDPTATVRDAGLVEDDVLVLINRAPQIDG